MWIPIPVPERIQKALVHLAKKRWEARRELLKGVPTPCRLVQLAFLGALVRLGWGVDEALNRMPSKARTTAKVGLIAFILADVAASVVILALVFIYDGTGTGLTALGLVGLVVAGIVIGIVGLIVGIIVISLALAFASRFCPFRIPGLEQAIMVNNG